VRKLFFYSFFNFLLLKKQLKSYFLEKE
jgi:hypothetical protein